MSATKELKCARIDLVVALHSLASNFENALYAFGADVEARTKAEGDIAHARKVAAQHNYNGSGCHGQSPPWMKCKHHGPAAPGVWACPTCLVELRDGIRKMKAVAS